MAIPFDTSSGGAHNTSRRKRHRRKKMLQNINVLVRVPELTGNTKKDLEAQQSFNKQLLRALDYLLGELDRRAEQAEQSLQNLEGKK